MYHLLRSDGWAIVRDIIDGSIKELRDVTTLPDDLSNEQLVREVAGRMLAVSLIETLYSQLHSISQNYEMYMLSQETEDSHIQHQ